MAQEIVLTGTGELTGDGETLRSAFEKININFRELYELSAAAEDLSTEYTASEPIYWKDPPPTSLHEAVDRLARLMFEQHNKQA
jgi:hypothetical protein